MIDYKKRLQVNSIYFIRNMKIDDTSDFLTEKLRNVGKVQPYSLRIIMDFRIQQANTTAKLKSIFYKGLNRYNMLPFDVRN